MPGKSFADLTRQVHLINDLILADMIYVGEDYAEEAANFKKHLLATKYWFSRISWANKRRYVMALLQDLNSAWALSLLLKSVWNCRPKDAVMSVAETRTLCSFDQVPVDHNRTAQPVKTLAQVMKNDRKWFHTLDPECQAMVLAELVTGGGGPLMWEMTRKAQAIFERYRDHQLKSLQECVVVSDPKGAKSSTPSTQKLPPMTQKATAATGQRRSRESGASLPGGVPTTAHAASNAQKQLDASLAAWNSTIKALKETQKLEEVEMTFDDGTKRKVWKVNRVKPEAMETVDFVQLLPSAIGKRILSFLPTAAFHEYAQVNKYWAYLVDELRAEWAVRLKINAELEKLKEVMLRHDTSLDDLAPDYGVAASSLGASLAPSLRVHLQVAPSMRPSEKSGFSYKFAYEKLKPSRRTIMVKRTLSGKEGLLLCLDVFPSLWGFHYKKQKPFRNMAELNDRLERRGAVDDNLWIWCRNVLKTAGKATQDQGQRNTEGVMRFGNAHFPCPLMKQSMAVPLPAPLFKDPSNSTSLPPHLKHNISNSSMLPAPKEAAGKRISLWSRDFSSLYKVFKVASYHMDPKTGKESLSQGS